MSVTLSPVRPQTGVVTRELSHYALRLGRWPMLAAGIAGSWLIVWWRAGEVTTADGAVWLVRGVAAVAAVAVVFALDDPSVDSTRALPAARGPLMRMRLGLMLSATLVAVAPAVVFTWDHLNVTATAGGVLIEVGTLLAVTSGAALLLQRQFGVSEPAQFVVLAVLGVFLAAQMVGARWPLLAGPGPEWAGAHWRWSGVLLVAGSVVTWQLRDAASRPLKRFLPR